MKDRLEPGSEKQKDKLFWKEVKTTQDQANEFRNKVTQIIICSFVGCGLGYILTHPKVLEFIIAAPNNFINFYTK